MVIIMLSQPGHVGQMLVLIGIKIVIAVLAGIVIDFIVKRNSVQGEENIKKLCSGCGCEHGIFLSALKHTAGIFAIVLAANIVLGGLIHLVGEDNLGEFMLSGSFFQPILAALIGLIPNCAASVLITELYLGGAITLSSAVAGLCAGAGVGLIVLFRANRNIKDCVKIIFLLFGISAAAADAYYFNGNNFCIFRIYFVSSHYLFSLYVLLLDLELSLLSYCNNIVIILQYFFL